METIGNIMQQNIIKTKDNINDHVNRKRTAKIEQ